MVHTNDQDPYVPVKVNKDGETVNLSNTSQRRGQDSTQDRAIARALLTVGPPSISMGHFQDHSANAPPGIATKLGLEPMEDPEEDQQPLVSWYSPKCFEAAFCLWYLKLDTKSQRELFSYGPEDFDLEHYGEARVVNYITRGVTEHLKYELGLKDDEQWIVLSWIRTCLDWELFRDARQIASTAIGLKELHEMTKRAVLTLPMADLRRPNPMTMEKGIFLAKPPEVSPGPSPTGSDSLSPLSSHSATPPSFQEEEKLGNDAVTCDPRKSAAVVCQMQMDLDPSGADRLLQLWWTAPQWPVLRPPILGRGTPLRLTAPLAVPGSQSMPLPETAVAAVPLPETAVAAVPLPETAVAAAPLPETAIAAAPLLETAVAAAPLPEELVLTAHSPLGATPPSRVGSLDCPSDGRFVEKMVVIEPARPEDFWITEDGASGPLPAEAEGAAPIHTNPISPMELPLVEAHVVGPAPLAVPEDSEISPGESPQEFLNSQEAPVEDTHSPARPRAGRPTVAEALQQRVVREQVTVTTIKSEEIIETQPPEARAELMIISGSNTPVAPDDSELDAEEEQELLMDKTRL